MQDNQLPVSCKMKYNLSLVIQWSKSMKLHEIYTLRFLFMNLWHSGLNTILQVGYFSKVQFKMPALSNVLHPYNITTLLLNLGSVVSYTDVGSKQPVRKQNWFKNPSAVCDDHLGKKTTNKLFYYVHLFSAWLQLKVSCCFWLLPGSHFKLLQNWKVNTFWPSLFYLHT